MIIPQNFTTGIPLESSGNITDIPLVYHRYKTGNETRILMLISTGIPLVYHLYTTDIPLEISQILPLISTGIPPIYNTIFAKTMFYCITPAHLKNM